jgi:hypothetical protein
MVAMGVSMMNKNGNANGAKNGLSGRGQISVEEVRLARDMWISAVQRLSVTETVALYDTDNVRLLGTVDTEGLVVLVCVCVCVWLFVDRTT